MKPEKSYVTKLKSTKHKFWNLNGEISTTNIEHNSKFLKVQYLKQQVYYLKCDWNLLHA